MAYITISNARRIIKKIDIKDLKNLDYPLYKWDIYFFNKLEVKQLLNLKEFLLNSKKYNNNIEVYNKIQVKDSFKYVFSESQPKYHKSSSCSRLQSHFKNFEIPDAIRNRGQQEILKFRTWFKQNKHIQDESTKKFIEKLQISFPYVGEINPKSIEFENTGMTTIKNYSLSELEKNIDDLLRAAGRFYKENQKVIGLYQRKTFLAYKDAPIENNETGLDDFELKYFLKSYDKQFKEPVKHLLEEYFRVLHNPELEFDGNLLENLGFSPCRSCYV